jgi:hypothetical protein
MKRLGIILMMLVFPFMLACGLVSSLLPAPTPTPTSTPTSTPLPTATPQPTGTPTSTPQPTETPDVAATQQYEDFYTVVQKQFDAKVIPSLDGVYTPLKDQTIASAKNGFYEWNQFKHATDNFILRAEVTMETANRSSATSACGFVFRTTSDTGHFVFLKQDGMAVYGLTGLEFTKKAYHILTNPAQFKLTLVVYHEVLRFFINDKLMISYDKVVYVPNFKGGWGPAVSSGSSQDFGTRCTFEKFELWEITE